jgi:hypothetical protein
MLNATIADFKWPISPVAKFIQTNHLHLQLQLLIPTFDRRNYSCQFFFKLFVCVYASTWLDRNAHAYILFVSFERH